MMRHKITALALAAVLLFIPLAGCGGEDAGELYPGQNNVPYPLPDQFKINIAGETKKILICMLTLEIDDPNMALVFDEKSYRLSEIVNLTVRTRTIDELNDTNAQNLMFDEIAAKINQEFQTETVKKVFFTEFLIY